MPSPLGNAQRIGAGATGNRVKPSGSTIRQSSSEASFSPMNSGCSRVSARNGKSAPATSGISSVNTPFSTVA